MEGMSSPPLALENKILAESADLLRPHHLFWILVTIGSRVRSTHVSGRSAMVSHVRRRHTHVHTHTRTHTRMHTHTHTHLPSPHECRCMFHVMHPLHTHTHTQYTLHISHITPLHATCLVWGILYTHIGRHRVTRGKNLTCTHCLHALRARENSIPMGARIQTHIARSTAESTAHGFSMLHRRNKERSSPGNSKWRLNKYIQVEWIQ